MNGTFSTGYRQQSQSGNKSEAVGGAQRSVVSPFAACYVVLFLKIFCLCAAAWVPPSPVPVRHV